MSEKQKASLLAKLKKANSKITKSQRQSIFDTAFDWFSKDTFYKIIAGKFVAENNIEFAKAILKRMELYEKENRKKLKQL